MKNMEARFLHGVHHFSHLLSKEFPHYDQNYNCSHIVTRLPTSTCIMVPNYQEKKLEKTLVYINPKHQNNVYSGNGTVEISLFGHTN
jgi:hypothetical protein